MTIYVVVNVYWGGSEFWAAFSNKEEAEKFVKQESEKYTSFIQLVVMETELIDKAE